MNPKRKPLTICRLRLDPYPRPPTNGKPANKNPRCQALTTRKCECSRWGRDSLPRANFPAPSIVAIDETPGQIISRGLEVIFLCKAHARIARVIATMVKQQIEQDGGQLG
jgi:hypothetical protein